MRRYAAYSDSETDYSETDESIVEVPRRRRAHMRRRSMSRHRGSPEYNTNLLSPVMQDVRVQRSASTGRRRPRNQPPAVVVDINNDVRNKGTNKNRRLSQQSYQDISEFEDEGLRYHQRPRAVSSVSREHSPFHRDYEMLIDQRILEENDSRQDLQLSRHQQEIERLERELARRRSGYGRHLLRDEEEWFEDEIHDKLKRLERMERKQRQEEERRRAELRYRMKKYEEEERLAQEREEVKAKLAEEKLKQLQREKEEEEEKERLKKEIRDEEARMKAEEEEKKKKAIKMKQQAVEEWKLEEERKRLNEEKEKEEQDRLFKERLKCEFGYTEEEIEKILSRKKHAEEKEHHHHDHGLVVREKEYEKTTWIKVHRRHLLPETLIAYRLPWDWDDRDSNYIIIKQWISEDFQEELFAHTRRIREGKLVAETSSSMTELKVNDKDRNKMYLVRKKSPRRSWIFT